MSFNINHQNIKFIRSVNDLKNFDPKSESSTSIFALVSSSCPHCKNEVENTLPKICGIKDKHNKTINCNVIDLNDKNTFKEFQNAFKLSELKAVPANTICKLNKKGSKLKIKCDPIEYGARNNEYFKSKLMEKKAIKKK